MEIVSDDESETEQSSHGFIRELLAAEPALLAQVFPLLCWSEAAALRSSHRGADEAFELMAAATPPEKAEICWVRVREEDHVGCLRFVANYCRNAQRLVITDSARFGEQALLRLVCGMRSLEALEVDAPAFGGGFPDPQRLMDRLAKYCPQLQHLSIALRCAAPTEHASLDSCVLQGLGRRLLTLDLGVVAVRIIGGSRTLACCCPQIQKLCVRLHQRPADHEDVVDPLDMAIGCPQLADLDLAPVEWDDQNLRQFAAQAPNLKGLALRTVARTKASPALVSGLALLAPGLKTLRLSLFARSDPVRAECWLLGVASLSSLRSLCLDYGAPLRFAWLVEHVLAVIGANLLTLVVHGCHGVGDAPLLATASVCPELHQLRILPDSWRVIGEVTDACVLALSAQLPQLKAFAVGSQRRLFGASDGVQMLLSERAPTKWRSLSLFSPLDDGACTLAWFLPRLEYLWLGPYQVMQPGVCVSSAITDAGLILIAARCAALEDLTVASLHITDAGFTAALYGCRNLRRLRLGGRGITGSALRTLAEQSQPRLERLSLWFSGVSAIDEREAAESMPWCHLDIETLSATLE